MFILYSKYELRHKGFLTYKLVYVHVRGTLLKLTISMKTTFTEVCFIIPNFIYDMYMYLI